MCDIVRMSIMTRHNKMMMGTDSMPMCLSKSQDEVGGRCMATMTRPHKIMERLVTIVSPFQNLRLGV
jgi:hypothetical protein